MATLTTNISNVSLAVSGRTTKSTTISWTCPTVPSSATISSCKLTGTATASMRSGSATITVNRTTVTSGRQFTINLGTNNTTSSVSATARGNRSSASGTVTFSNLVYTVEYSIPTYTVTFVDYDGTVLKTQTVEEGSSATAPADPSRNGYEFTGWDKSFSNITSNLTVTAQYTARVLSNTNLRVKENGNWIPIKKVYRNVWGVWSDMSNMIDTNFDTTFKYVNRTVPTAILYEDGTLLLSSMPFIDNTHGNIVSSYTNWNSESLNSWLWQADKNNIKEVYTVDTIKGKANLAHMFNGCPSLTTLDLSGLDTSNTTNMDFMFYNCKALTSLDLSNFNTSNVTTMNRLFNNCKALTSLDLSNFNTSKITEMFAMFQYCNALASLDLSSFDTSNVTTMERMFDGCTSLSFLDLSSFDMTKVTNVDYMFKDCTNSNLMIYVKDEATKTKIKDGFGFPEKAKVVIGTPN